MSLLDPIAPYLALIDRIISLIQAGKTRRKDYFEKIIDPLYKDWVPLAEDTLSLLREARDAVETDGLITRKQVESLREHRDKFADSRTRLMSLFRVCREDLEAKDDDDLMGLVLSMLEFFQIDAYDPRGEGHAGQVISRGRALVELFDESVTSFERSEQMADDNTKNKLVDYLHKSITRLELEWQGVSGVYMKMKLKYTTS